MNWKWHEGGDHDLMRHYPNICLEILRKTIFNLSHESTCLGWNLNLGSTEYEARGLPNWVQILVLLELYNKCMGYVDQGERTAHNIPLIAASPWFSHYKHLHCILSWHLPWETQKTIPDFNHNSLSLGWDFVLGFRSTVRWAKEIRTGSCVINCCTWGGKKKNFCHLFDLIILNI